MTKQPFRFFWLSLLICFSISVTATAQTMDIPDPNAGEPYTVRVILFHPNDHQPRSDIDTVLDSLVKQVQQFYADEMERHGFGRKTFRLETDVHDKIVVHRVEGKFTNIHYYEAPSRIEEADREFEERFGKSRNIIYLIWVDLDEPNEVWSQVGGNAHGDSFGGTARIGATDFDTAPPLLYIRAWTTIAHELGHAFGLPHDYRDNRHIMSYGDHVLTDQLSQCAARWLNAHRYFNTNQTDIDEDPTTIQMLKSSLASPPNTIRLQFAISDSDGLHQALLLTNPIDPGREESDSPKVLDCKSLNGEGSVEVEFDTTELAGRSEYVGLAVIDSHGNFSRTTFPIDVASLRSSSEVVSIPDVNLAAAIRENLGLAASDVITQLDMLDLTSLNHHYFELTEAQLTLLEQLPEGFEISVPAPGSQISNLSGLERAVNLKYVDLRGNQISDLTPFTGLIRMRSLLIQNNHIDDVNPLAGLTQLSTLFLSDNQITAVSPLAELKNLISLGLNRNAIRDVAPLAGLKKLRILSLLSNQITDITPLANLTLLGNLSLGDNEISDLASLVGLNNLESVTVRGNALSYSSIHTHIPALQERGIEVSFDHRTPHRIRIVSGDDQQGFPGATLQQPFVVEVQDESGVVFEGVPIIFTVTGGGGTLSETTATTDSNGWAESILTLGPAAGTNTVSVSVAGIEGIETFNASATSIKFDLSVPAGISLIHVPLKVNAVDDVVKTIESISELYDALGGAGTVNFLITRDSQTQEWHSYFGPSDKDGPADRVMTDDMGIIVGLKAPVSVQLTGDALGTNGNSAINLSPGLNVVGLPLNDSRINRVSDLFTLDGIGGNVPVIILTDSGEFKLVGRAGDPGDIEITGGQAFIMTPSQDATVAISGDAWANGSGTAAAPAVTRKGIKVGTTTPVLGLRGAIVEEGTGLNNAGFRVTVKNLSTGRAFATVTTPDEAGYRSTVVDIETGRAATVGDVLEISARSPNPFIGVESLRYTVTAEDVKRSLIQLPSLVAYEIPSETQLLRNYPNPFNPETWIPYHLANDSDVLLSIYDINGALVRELDLGHQRAGYYTDRTRAAYWDGRNEWGEQVATGVYFYQLRADDYLKLRKMVIVK